VELFAVRGELGSFMKSRFKTLCVSKSKDGKRESKDYGWNERDGHHLWTNSIAVAHKYILSGGGESLQTLVLGNTAFKMKRDEGRLINAFVEHCPNVRSLSVFEKGSSWVNAFGKQLEILELGTVFSINFPVYSTKLREFTLNVYSEGTTSTELWRQIGSSLEKLNVHNALLSENEMRDVKQHCRNLKNSFHLETGDMDRLFTGLNMLGPRLEVIYIQYFEITETVDGWKNAWSNATSLRKLYIKGSKSGDVEAIFSTPKEHLKELVLPIPHDTDAGEEKKLMDVVAKGTKCVEAFSVFGFNFYRNSVKDFLEQNKYSLSSIVVYSESY